MLKETYEWLEEKRKSLGLKCILISVSDWGKGIKVEKEGCEGVERRGDITSDDVDDSFIDKAAEWFEEAKR